MTHAQAITLVLVSGFAIAVAIVTAAYNLDIVVNVLVGTIDLSIRGIIKFASSYPITVGTLLIIGSGFGIYRTVKRMLK